MLSTPHRDTDVKKVLKKLRDVLQSKGLFESLAEEFETAKLVHEKMDKLDPPEYKRRDTKVHTGSRAGDPRLARQRVCRCGRGGEGR